MEKRLTIFNWVTLGICFMVMLFGLAQLGFLIGYVAVSKDFSLEQIGYTPLASVFAGIAAIYLFVRTIKNASTSTGIKD
ncbi:hypothetical protein [uncultured Psychrosphaera sp.]|uniref:hypothetical protein n=1 Tax=uncultured Psychrosphaera sp. TaxID=1403522 RepID=UPI0030F8E363